MSTQRRTLVIGAGGGIGSAIADAFLEIGDEVTVADISWSAPPSPAQRVTVDLTDEASVVRLFSENEAYDVIVNAVGIYPNTLVSEMEVSEWDTVLDVNLRGSFLVGREAIRSFQRHGTPAEAARRMIFISSGAAWSGRPGAAHYCASKAGLEGLVRVLAIEAAEYGATVNAVSPGLIEVDNVRGFDRNYIHQLVDTLPIPRLGQPEEIASVCRFFASREADYVTGAVWQVDGGAATGRPLPMN